MRLFWFTETTIAVKHREWLGNDYHAVITAKTVLNSSCQRRILIGVKTVMLNYR
jgi:hypothetical protein